MSQITSMYLLWLSLTEVHTVVHGVLTTSLFHREGHPPKLLCKRTKGETAAKKGSERRGDQPRQKLHVAWAELSRGVRDHVTGSGPDGRTIGRVYVVKK